MARTSSPMRGRVLPSAVTGGVLGLAALAGASTLAWQPFGAEAPPPVDVESHIGEASQTVATQASARVARARPEAAAQDDPAPEPRPKGGWAVPRATTPLDEVAIARVLREAHELELGEAPSDARLGVAWAHIALENARGEKIDNNNFGNLTIWEKEPGAHFVRILRERRPVKRGSTVTRWRWVEMRFRAFDTPVQGARAYWAHLVEKFPAAVERFDYGDAEGAGRKLARLGYASAFSMSYSSSLDNLYDEYRRRIAPRLGEGLEEGLLREEARRSP